MATCQPTVHNHNVEIPVPKGICLVEQTMTLPLTLCHMKINGPHWAPIVARVWSFGQ